MTGRLLLTAQCLRRGHWLARVYASPDGMRIVLALAAGVRAPTATGIGRGRGTRGFSEPFEAHMSYTATCDCGSGHLVNCAALARAIESGQRKVKIAPNM